MSDQKLDTGHIVGGETVQFSPAPSAIVFYSDGREALRITRDGVTGNPDVPTDEAAKAIIAALDAQIKALR